jgi:cell division protein FtsB
MRMAKYLVPLWIGVVIYAAAVVTVGKIGLQAYDELLREHGKQRQNLDRLYKINENLTGIRDALKYDGDTIAVHARDLGYASKDERFIRIVGADSVRMSQLSEGELVQIETSDFIEDKALRIIAICVAGVLFLFLLFIDLLKTLAGGKSYR